MPSKYVKKPRVSRLIDMTGFVSGKLTVIEYAGRNSHGASIWRCSCECGGASVVLGVSLRKGRTQSCGCGSSKHTIGQTGARRLSKHGMAKRHPLWGVWVQMRARCNPSRAAEFPSYAGRGIKVCERWQNDFTAFLDDMMPTWVKGSTLDRIDVNGDYEPSNCRWADWLTQSNNRRTNTWVDTVLGRMTLADAARASGLKYTTIRRRHSAGWPDASLLLPLGTSP